VQDTPGDGNPTNNLNQPATAHQRLDHARPTSGLAYGETPLDVMKERGLRSP
jgi:hypothetical protein